MYFIKFRTSLAIILANIHLVSFSLPSWDSYYVCISTLDLILLVSDSINFSSLFHSTPQTWSFQVAYLYAHKFFPLPAKICYLNLQVNSEFSFHYCMFISPEFIFLFIISMSLLAVSIYSAVILLVSFSSLSMISFSSFSIFQILDSKYLFNKFNSITSSGTISISLFCDWAILCCLCILHN